MKSIYSSKLYKASSRKSRIHAALMAPGNVSLVQQLAEDLDEEYKTPENLGVDKSDTAKSAESESDFNDFIVDEDVNPETDLMTMDDLTSPKPSGGHSSSHPSPSFKSKHSEGSEEKSEPNSEENNQLMPESPANEKPQAESQPKEEPAEASTKITSCVDLNLNVLKGSLNSREDTQGVTRIAEKENEIWLYYNDDVNLNNIMTSVIEYIANAGYTNLEFNRLARSDNAIVFLREQQSDKELKTLNEYVAKE